jgi:hypothetical protein
MSVPHAKVKSVCTAAEVDLVKSSRGAELKKLTLVEARQHAKRARNLLEKSQKLGRTQARPNAKISVGATPERTQLKEEIFRDALVAFEVQAERLETAGASSKVPKQTTKAKRASGHRADRAVVRSELTEEKRTINKKKAAKKKVAKKKTAKKPAPAEVIAPAAESTKGKKATKKKVAKRVVKKKVAKKKTTKKTTAKEANIAVTSKRKAKGSAGLHVDNLSQLEVQAAAKQNRLDKSGVTSRVQGHVAARNRRNQARRQSK